MVLAFPRSFYRQFRAAPLVVRVLILLVAAGAIGGTGYYLVELRGQRVRASQTIIAWQEFEARSQSGAEPEELLAILDRVLALNPADPTAARRRAALERWAADPDDQAMVSLLLRLHLRQGRTEAAAIEAEKRLAHLPNDYLSHCARAAYLLSRGDRAGAGPHLDRLADPEAPGASPDPSGLLFALYLLQVSGKDATPVRAFLVRRLLPLLRGERVAQVPAGAQAALVACYAETFAAGPDAVPVLAEHWALASRIAALALEAAQQDKNVKTLTLLANQGPKLSAGLARLRAANQVTDSERATLSAELEERTRAAWRAVLEVEPKNPAAFQGLALSYLREGQVQVAWETLLDGFRTCKDDIRLFSLLSIMLQSQDRATVAMNELFAAAERNPQVPEWWMMAAEAAMAANRRDLAIEACQKARSAAPNSHRLAVLEARLWLAGGYPDKAADLFGRLPDSVLVADPAAARAYTRAAIEAGKSGTVDAFLTKVEAASNAADNPAPIAAALRGMFDASPDMSRAAAVAERAATVLARWGTDPDIALLRAQALLRQVELGPPNWDPAATREAVRAFDRAVALNPADLRPAAGLAWVRLRGMNSPDQALKDAAPLIAAGSRLPVDAAEVLGAVYLANNQLEAAATVLEQARQSHQRTAGCMVQLALLYHARGQHAAARQALAEARGLPQSPRERADYQNAFTLLQRDQR